MIKKIKAKDLTFDYEIEINGDFHKIASIVNYFDDYVDVFLGQYGADEYSFDGDEEITVREDENLDWLFKGERE